MIKELNTAEICSLLKTAKTIAVVGISSDPSKISRKIADILIENNYRVVGVNPAAPVIPGIPVYKSISEIPYQVDIVNVFRKSETIADIIPEVVKINPKCLWLQEGIRNDEAVQAAFDGGISIVQDKCIWICFNQCLSMN
jgi:uncharacterized protein